MLPKTAAAVRSNPAFDLYLTLKLLCDFIFQFQWGGPPVSSLSDHNSRSRVGILNGGRSHNTGRSKVRTNCAQLRTNLVDTAYGISQMGSLRHCIGTRRPAAWTAPVSKWKQTQVCALISLSRSDAVDEPLLTPWGGCGRRARHLGTCCSIALAVGGC